MKNLFILSLLIIGVLACNKDDDSFRGCTQQNLSFRNDKGITLNIDNATWQLAENGIGGGNVSLIMQGQINGDSATYRTYGDGLLFDAKIVLDNDKHFNINSGISFSATSLPEGEFTDCTLIRVFKNTDTLTINLESCTLSY